MLSRGHITVTIKVPSESERHEADRKPRDLSPVFLDTLGRWLAAFVWARISVVFGNRSG